MPIRCEPLWAVVPGALILAATLSAGRPALAEAPDEAVRRELTDLLERRVATLVKARNERGLPYLRGSFSHHFVRESDSTYVTTFHKDTVSPDAMTTERLRLTLGRSENGRWEITGENVEDRYDGLVRSVPGDETFHRFDRLAVAYEGLELQATDGTLYVDYLAGEPAWIRLAADELAFDYAPPDGVSAHTRHTFAFARADEPERFTYEPELVLFACSPEECASILEAAEGLRGAVVDALHAPLRRRYRNGLERQQKLRRDDAFFGFRQPFTPERRYCSTQILGKHRDHGSWLIRDNQGGFEVRFGAAGYGTLLGYASAESRERGLSPYELEQRPDQDARDFEVVGIRGEVDLALDDPETMHGDITYHLRTRHALRELPVFVARLRAGGGTRKQMRDPSLVLQSIRDGDGRELTWVKTSSAGGWVVLAERVSAGSDLTLRVQFRNKGAIYKYSPSYSRMARGGWLPFVRFADMIDEFDLTVRVPERYTVLGIGKRVSREVRDGVATTRWIAERPVTFPTIIFGDYVSRKPSFDAERSDGSTIPVTVFVDRDGMTDWGIRPRQLPALAEQAANSLNFYREVFGVDYPFAKLDLVNDPFGFLYGQSPASLVYLGSGAFRGEGMLGSIAGSDWTTFTKSLVAHEVGHQWWGGLVANANDRSYWFVESLAEYASALFVEAVHGRTRRDRGWKAYLDHVKVWRKGTLDAKLYGSVQDARVLATGGYRAALYAKGPYAFHMLRMMFGDDEFFAFLERLARELEGKEIVSRDIQSVAEQAFGGTMEWFFDQWIRGVGLPEYTLEYDTRRTEDGNYVVQGRVLQRVVVEGKRRHELDDVAFRSMVPVTARGRKTRERYTVKLLVETPETPFRFKIPEEPVKVTLNEAGETLAHNVVAHRPD